jgi:hypothetical protein
MIETKNLPYHRGGANSSRRGASYPMFILGGNKMRQTVIATAVLLAIIVAVFGATVITADAPRKAAQAAATSGSIDVMGMTRDTKGLSVEQFDAI